MYGFTLNGLNRVHFFWSKEFRQSPQMGGMECLDELLGINPGVKVILTSGYSLNGQGKEAMRPELRGFIRKPFQVADLLTAVRKALDA